MERSFRPLLRGSLVVAVALWSAAAAAQDRGFRVHRFDGSAVGSTLFLLDRPWYSGTRYGAVGVTFDYSHRPLQSRVATGRGTGGPVLSSAMIGHVDLAGSLFDRLRVTASLPVTFLETGTPEVLSNTSPLMGIGFGDPRVGVMARVFGQGDTDAFSLHVAADVWIPIGFSQVHQSDTGVRIMPRAILAGSFGEVGQWTFEGAFLFRPYASLGTPALGMIAASEARAGLSIGASLLDHHLTLAPEVLFSTQVVGVDAFSVNGMSLELLGSASVLLFNTLMLNVAGGTALFGAAGTPDARGMVRLSWAPRLVPNTDRFLPPECPNAPGCVDESDPDADGVKTEVDRCPFEPETMNGIRDSDGCPEFEGERFAALITGKPLPVAPEVKAAPVEPPTRLATVDAGQATAPVVGVPPPRDAGLPLAVVAPVVARDAGIPLATVAPADGGASPMATPVIASSADAGIAANAQATFTTSDVDGDHLVDEVDRCPLSPEDLDGFEDEDGCPEFDDDDDRIADWNDRCPAEAEVFNGIDDEDGCPDTAPDGDQDTIADAVDRCPYEPETADGVRDEDGCPEFKPPEYAALVKVLAPTIVHPSLLVPTATPDATDARPPALPPPDSDKDGVIDDEDRCPVVPEDLDGFEDDDGCREPDNDEDGIVDAKDQCPDVAETFNGWKDEDGCADVHEDVDADGVEYVADRCPYEPGTGDGCPREPLPKLALPGFPGLPTPAPVAPDAPPVELSPEVAALAATADFDKDGTPDEADACPMSAEDRDEFEDEDGCPEPDNDGDGIEDKKDKCPLVAETINGNKDDDGCPDEGVSVVSIKAHAVVIDGVIRFKSGSATLEKGSLSLIQQVASTLKSARTLSVEIQGHTDDVGNAAQNIKLSKKRADAIRAVLIKEGVQAFRLIANGYGPTRPRTSNRTPAGREQNRRVEFVILGESK